MSSDLIEIEAGSTLRVLGQRVSERNARAARFAGFDPQVVDAPSATPCIWVPATTVLELGFFDSLREHGHGRRYTGPDGTTLGDGSNDGASQDVPVVQLAPGAVYDVSSLANRRAAEHAILRATEKPTDGVVSRNFNRPQSRFFSLWLSRARLSPNFASLLSLLVGIACGYFAAQPGRLNIAITGVLFQIASMFDGVDGEMARSSYRQSPTGALIDSAVDNLTYVFALTGFAIGWYREGLSDFDRPVLLTALVLVIITMGQVFHFVRNNAPNASMVFFDSSVRRAAQDSNSVLLKSVAFFLYATRRDVLALVFMVVSLSGSRLAIVCLVILGALVTNVALVGYRRNLLEAAKTLHDPATQS